MGEGFENRNSIFNFRQGCVVGDNVAAAGAKGLKLSCKDHIRCDDDDGWTGHLFRCRANIESN